MVWRKGIKVVSKLPWFPMAALTGQADLHQFYYTKVYHDSFKKGLLIPPETGLRFLIEAH